MAEEYDPRGVFASLYRKTPDIRGSGYPKLSFSFNLWLYRNLERWLDKSLSRLGIEVKDAKVLEFASGAGYFTRFFERRAPAALTGVDITSESVNLLTERHPGFTFIEADITGPGLEPPGGPFDLATAISVLYHVLDDAKFKQAIHNLGKSLKPGGWAIVNDALPEKSTDPKGHVRFRSIDLHKEAMEAAGLELIEIIPLVYWGGEPVGDPESPEVKQAARTWEALSHQARKSEVRGWMAGALYYLMNHERKVDDPLALPHPKLLVAKKL